MRKESQAEPANAEGQRRIVIGHDNGLRRRTTHQPISAQYAQCPLKGISRLPKLHKRLQLLVVWMDEEYVLDVAVKEGVGHDLQDEGVSNVRCRHKDEKEAPR